MLTDPTFDPPGDHPRPGTNIVLRKLAGPSIPLRELLPIDAVLLSHDHHADNLDPVGARDARRRPARVLTTGAGAERLGAQRDRPRPRRRPSSSSVPDGGAVTVTAVAGRARPAGGRVEERPGDRLHAPRRRTCPRSTSAATTRRSTSSREIVAEHSPIDAAVLFIGGAQVPEAWGDAFLTLTAQTAVEAARACSARRRSSRSIRTAGRTSPRTRTSSARAFADTGLSDRLRMVAPGDEVALDARFDS